MANSKGFKNPFRPGAGHMPPYLAGREAEVKEFKRLLEQDVIFENLVLTGLRGVGKTVLLETFKPQAIQAGWLWLGTDLSESSSITDENLVIRLMTDLSVVTSNLIIRQEELAGIGLTRQTEKIHHRLDYLALNELYQSTPGLVADKLKQVLETAWEHLQPFAKRGLIFAYDEAQNLADQADDKQYPLSLLLDVFQSIQKKQIPFMLALTGLPTLFPKLVEARTFAERMFRVVAIDRLHEADSREAILEPMKSERCPVTFTEESVRMVIRISGGYPYLIQFICREVYDVVLQRLDAGEDQPMVPMDGIVRKLDTDFFAGRWARATDRQRDLLIVISKLASADSEFTVQEIVEMSVESSHKPFSPSHVSQMLASLADAGLVYKNRYGKYSFAVPLLGQFIQRQLKQLSPRARGLFD